ncbi:TonB-dependent receptor domain-containing protein [Geojedonia litorea]|uniref:TonB-dependent receptor domain-containing protein n=1 Tax=Geojedonia litorea TaxID=1268269 RepID=A0ABV9N4R2_9FLAO
MRILLYATLFCMTYLTTSAQNFIEGHIIDEDHTEAIVFANIYMPQIEKGTTTNEKGYFKIENIASGTYKIVVSYIGYETKSLQLKIPTDTPVRIALKSSAIEMEEIIVSTPFHKLQSENVMKVERENISDLRSKGAMNLSDGLSNIAGVETITTGLSIGKPVIRGLSSNRVLVYAQGVRLENQQFGDEHGLGLSAAGIESIEVIKGPASLLYGSDALGGVLYLNPERFAKENTSAADGNFNYFSNTNGFNTNAGYKVSKGKFKYIFRAGLAEHADYQTQEYRVTNTRFKEKDFKAALGYQASKFKTELRYNVNASKLGIPEEIGVQSTNVTPLLPFQDITNHIFSSKSVLFFEDSNLEINLGYLYNDRKEFEEHHEEDEEEEEEEHEVLEAALQMKLKTFNYDIKYHLPEIGRFETILGVQGMNQTNTNYGEEQLIPNASTNDFGLLATSHIHFDLLDVQLGARYDNRNIDVESGLTKSFNSFNGALGFKTNIANKITARLNFATGFRAPNLAELTSDGSHEGTNRYEIGNPNLKNEQNFQTDLALEFKNDHIELFVNGFYNKVNNYIFIAPNGQIIDGDDVFVYEQNDAKLFGGEIGLHFHPHPLDWLHIESSFESVTGKQNDNSYLPLIPANSINNKVRVELVNDWLSEGYAFLKLTTTLKQDNLSEFETITPGYNLLSAGMGGKITVLNHELQINISGNNLTDKSYIHHLSRLKSEGIYNIGRNFSLGLTYTL